MRRHTGGGSGSPSLVEVAETASQFMSRLSIYFSRWIGMAKVGQTYDDLRDKMLREQFLLMCHDDLATFLKERMPELGSVENFAYTAEQSVDPHRCSLVSKQSGLAVDKAIWVSRVA